MKCITREEQLESIHKTNQTHPECDVPAGAGDLLRGDPAPPAQHAPRVRRRLQPRAGRARDRAGADEDVDQRRRDDGVGDHAVQHGPQLAALRRGDRLDVGRYLKYVFITGTTF